VKTAENYRSSKRKPKPNQRWLV